MDISGRLQSHPLFASLCPEALAEAVQAATAVVYEPQDICIRQGEAGEVFGVLITGRLEAVRDRGTGNERKLGPIGPGECFGEMSMLTGDPTGADVVATERSQAVVFLQERVGPILATSREAVRQLAKLMSSRLAPSVPAAGAPRPAVAQYSLGASSPMRILSVSCRRDDIRYSYYDTTSETARATGSVAGLGSEHAVHTYSGPRGPRQVDITAATHEAALSAAIEALTCAEDGVLGSAEELSVVGHRVCHGGLEFDGPAVVDAGVMDRIGRLASFAPMENPYNLSGIRAFQRLAPSVPQVAVFDTAFYLKLPEAASRYALPADLTEDGRLRRFGCHGISHQSAAQAACRHLGLDMRALKVITCHLGTGASITAIDHGRAVDTTMGATPLEGLVMARRPGDVDPGLLLYLMEQKNITPARLAERLYSDSGLLGLSGVSADVLSVLEAADKGDARALLAIEVFCRRARKYLASFIALLGGVDVVVFTGGVGQNAPGIRARICQGLEWMGITLEERANRAAEVSPGAAAVISQSQSRAAILAVGSNEDHAIARQAVRAMAQQRVTQVIRSQQRAIPIGISAHHVHLTQEHVERLFGTGHQLTWYADLTQPGQFACQEKVSLIGPKGRIDRVRVLGPVRAETQVEIARTEEYKLGIDAPVRMSGDLDGSPPITLEGTSGQVHLERGAICAMRHIHMSPEDAMAFAVRDRDVVRIRVPGDRSLIFGDVAVRIRPDFRLDMHIDTDEANAAELGGGAEGYLDSIQERASR